MLFNEHVEADKKVVFTKQDIKSLYIMKPASELTEDEKEMNYTIEDSEQLFSHEDTKEYFDYMFGIFEPGTNK